METGRVSWLDPSPGNTGNSLCKKRYVPTVIIHKWHRLSQFSFPSLVFLYLSLSFSAVLNPLLWEVGWCMNVGKKYQNLERKFNTLKVAIPKMTCIFWQGILVCKDDNINTYYSLNHQAVLNIFLPYLKSGGYKLSFKTLQTKKIIRIRIYIICPVSKAGKRQNQDPSPGLSDCHFHSFSTAECCQTPWLSESCIMPTGSQPSSSKRQE